MDNEIKKWIKKVQKKSDRESANKLISYYYTEVYGYIYKQSPVKDVALDVTQETFMGMIQSINGYDEKKASFRTWLYKIATYQIIKYYRSKEYRWHQQSDEIVDNLIDERNFGENISCQLEVEEIIDVLNQMDTMRQQVFRLKMFNENTFAEISELLDIPESTAKTKYYSTVKHIRQALKEEV